MPTPLGERLSQLRRERGMSQEVLAQTLEVSRQAISKWERGECAPDTENLVALARLYDVSLDGLLGIEGLGQQHTNSTDEGRMGKRPNRGVLVPVIAVVLAACALAPLALSALVSWSLTTFATGAISSGGWTLETPSEWRVTMNQDADGTPSWSLQHGSSAATITIIPQKQVVAESTARTLFDSLGNNEPLVRRDQHIGQYQGVTTESPQEGVWVFAGDNGAYGITATVSSPKRYGRTVRVVRKSISKLKHNEQ